LKYSVNYLVFIHRLATIIKSRLIFGPARKEGYSEVPQSEYVSSVFLPSNPLVHMQHVTPRRGKVND